MIPVLFLFQFKVEQRTTHGVKILQMTSLHARTLWEHCQKSTTMIPIDIGKGFLLLDDENHFYLVRDCDLTIILLSIPSSRLVLT